MTNVIDDTESGMVALLAILIGIFAFWFFGGWSFLRGLGNGGGDVTGLAQSLKNMGQGFPSGSDPGTVPAAQFLQGIAESFRNFGGYVFGGGGSSDLGSATADEQLKVLESYQTPTPEYAAQIAAAAPGQWQSWLGGIQSDPGGTSIGQSPLF